MDRLSNTFSIPLLPTLNWPDIRRLRTFFCETLRSRPKSESRFSTQSFESEALWFGFQLSILIFLRSSSSSCPLSRGVSVFLCAHANLFRLKQFSISACVCSPAINNKISAIAASVERLWSEQFWHISKTFSLPVHTALFDEFAFNYLRSKAEKRTDWSSSRKRSGSKLKYCFYLIRAQGIDRWTKTRLIHDPLAERNQPYFVITERPIAVVLCHRKRQYFIYM